MCKSTQDLTVFLQTIAQVLELDDEDISIQIYPDKSFRLYVHTRQEEPVYDSEELAISKMRDINDLLYEDPLQIANIIRMKLDSADNELQGTLSPEELER